MGEPHPDVPEQYQRLVKTQTIVMMDAAKLIWATVKELGSGRFEAEGGGIKVVITRQEEE